MNSEVFLTSKKKKISNVSMSETFSTSIIYFFFFDCESVVDVKMFDFFFIFDFESVPDVKKEKKIKHFDVGNAPAVKKK